MTQRQYVCSILTTTCERSSDSSSEKDDVDMEVSLEDITDEEALLACHSYLLRRKRLPWKQHEIRKSLQRKSPSIGYFWEDPSELKYLSSSSDDDDNDYDDFDFDDYDNESSQQTDQEEEYIRGGEFFSIHPWNPSESYRRKSEAKKKLFQNSSWKTKWYQARWGSLSSTDVRSSSSTRSGGTTTSNSDRKSERLVKAIPAEILRSPELAALTETEIEHAIITYITANRKRSLKQKSKQKSIPNTIIANNNNNNNTGGIGFEIHPSSPQLQQQLQQKQQERSQRAKKAYQTRRSNQQKQKRKQTNNHNDKQTIKRQPNIIIQDQDDTPNQNTSPYAAIDRLAQCVLLSPSSSTDHVIIPQRNDVISVLRPLRLARRKSILQQILFQIFNKRGKSIPILPSFNEDTIIANTILYNTTTSSLDYQQAWNQLMTSYHNHANDINPSYKFVTKCTNQELGFYILYLINMYESSLPRQQENTVS